jgi:hypothetical protein
MFVIKSTFIGNFTLGDNIVHNLNVFGLLSCLYEQNSDGKRLLCKPIILKLVSIIKAILHDFHNRIKLFTIEDVTNIPDVAED